MSQLPIPTALDQVTPDWLTSALREAGALDGARVTRADREIIGAGVGILGELARVTLSYDRPQPAAPKSVVAKIPTADPGGRGVGMALGFYNKEVLFYQQLGESAGLPSPRCYWSATDNTTGQYFVLMEDLGGLRIGDQLEGCTLDDARTILGGAAKFHARWWQDPRLDGLDWIPPVNAPVYRFVPVAYAQAIEPFLATLGARLSDAQKAIARELGPRIVSLQDSMVDAPMTLVHGDLRLDNVFYGSSDGSRQVTFIDWQIASRGTGVYDVGYFLSQSMEPALRKANEEALVREYHQQLVAGGVKGYSWEQCWQDYRKVILYCLVYPVISIGTIDLANERGVALGNAMTERCVAAISDLKADKFLKDLAPD